MNNLARIIMNIAQDYKTKFIAWVGSEYHEAVFDDSTGNNRHGWGMARS
jgi:hypothetical protein